MAIQIAKKSLKIAKKNEKPDLCYSNFAWVKIQNWDFFGIFKHCQIGVYSENRINLTVAKKSCDGAYVGEKTISCSVLPIILIECT